MSLLNRGVASYRLRSIKTTSSFDEAPEVEDRTQRRGSDKWDWPLRTNPNFLNVSNTRDKFHVELEAQLFSLDEIEVKTHENEVWLYFKHDDSKKKGDLVKREFQRRYKLPNDVNMATLRTHLRHDGMLVIEADKRY